MEDQVGRLRSHRQSFYEGAVVVGVLVAAMWLVEIVNALDNQRLDSDGIIARHLSGLPGILSAPFLHASFAHLLANTIPLIILGLVIAFDGPVRLIALTAVAAVVSGLGAWALSSTGTDTIGASGVVFGYATFLLARGFFARSFLQIAIGLIVAVLFGGALLLSIAPQSGVSWQAHVFGAVGGLLTAWLVSRRTKTAPENK
ncbi:MAG: rhomboid family intramembrane serine protease [Solirubrobacteraceae bacterium]|jgi:membrane associated rhomboid family serine protease